MLYNLILWFFLHPIHISVTDITYDEKEKELEIVSRIFIDDLETAIRAAQNLPELELLNPPAGKTRDVFVEPYLLQHLQVSLDGKPQKLKYLGSEIEDDALVCYVQIAQVKKWKAISITNTVIHETYNDQSNIVHVTVREKIKSLRLMRSNPSGTLTFDII